MTKKNTCEINRALDHGCCYVDVATTPCDESIDPIGKTQSNNKIPNIAIELLPKPESFTERPQFKLMAFYNDSNRVPDHKTRWNSR
jgi:hypothetical protein